MRDVAMVGHTRFEFMWCMEKRAAKIHPSEGG